MKYVHLLTENSLVEVGVIDARAYLLRALLLHPPFQELLICILWLKTVRTSIVLKVVVHICKI